MRLQAWINSQADRIATRDELETFESDLLEGWALAAEADLAVVAFDADLDANVWALAFGYWRLMCARAARLATLAIIRGDS